MTLPKVAIACPYYENVKGPTFFSGLALGLYSGQFIEAMPIETTGCYVEDNRNGAVQFALATGIPFGWFFTIDSDMIFPHDALLRLIAHDKDIVGANYRQRTPPFRYAGAYKDKDTVEIEGERKSKLLEPGLWEMDHIPGGLMLIRFEILKKMEYPWFHADDHGALRDEVYFCHKARSFGYKVWADHDLTRQVRHRGDQDIPWFTEEQIKVVKGARINFEENEEEAMKRAAMSNKQFQDVSVNKENSRFVIS